MSSEFVLAEFHESAATFHAREVPAPASAAVWHNVVAAPALVLGSTQRDLSIVDLDACRAAAVDVVQRRSGGGAVLLIPDEVTWIDVIVPRDGVSSLSDDVHAPMIWLGEQIAAAIGAVLASAGDDRTVEVRGKGMVDTTWSRLICFDGMGPGEVLLDGRKLVGISQRRTRTASRLQCSWYARYDPRRLVELLAPAVRPDADDLQPVATLDAALSTQVLAHLVANLTR